MDKIVAPNAPSGEIADDARAPPHVRHLYEDIRLTLETPVVNLVFRRLAGMGPEVLGDVWGLLRPAYRDGSIARHAAGVVAVLADEINAVAAEKPGPEISTREQATIEVLVANYNENNARNLIAFSALLGGNISGTASARMPATYEQSHVAAVRGAVELPALPNPRELPASVWAAVQRLNALGDSGEPGSPVASLYVHLAHWPPMLAYLETVLSPLHAEGRLGRWRIETRESASASHLAGLRAPPELRDRIAPALTALVHNTIPKMVPIGCLLAALLAKKKRESGT